MGLSLHQLLSAYPCSLNAQVNASTSPSSVRGDWAERDFPPTRGKALPQPGVPGRERARPQRRHEPGPPLRGKPGGSSRERESAEASELPGSWREPHWVRREGDHAPVPALPAPEASRSPFPPWPLAPAAPPAIALQLPAFQASAGAAAPSRPDDATRGTRVTGAAHTGQFQAGKGWGPTLRATWASCTAGGGSEISRCARKCVCVVCGQACAA